MASANPTETHQYIEQHREEAAVTGQSLGKNASGFHHKQCPTLGGLLEKALCFKSLTEEKLQKINMYAYIYTLHHTGSNPGGKIFCLCSIGVFYMCLLQVTAFSPSWWCCPICSPALKTIVILFNDYLPSDNRDVQVPFFLPVPQPQFVQLYEVIFKYRNLEIQALINNKKKTTLHN